MLSPSLLTHLPTYLPTYPIPVALSAQCARPVLFRRFFLPPTSNRAYQAAVSLVASLCFSLDQYLALSRSHPL